MPSFDLYLLPLVRQSGQEHYEFPGLYAVSPPRRTARGRDGDDLILYLSLTGNLPLTPEQHNLLLARMAQTYYRTAGTVTSAMRVVADALNQFLLDRNLSMPGQQAIGLLIQAVLRGQILYLAHNGPVHTFWISSPETQHWHDPQGAGRGLGLGRMTNIRFFQAQLQPNDFILLAHQPSEAWNAASMKTSLSQGMESQRRRLMTQTGADSDLNAVLIQALAGTGKLRLLRLKPAFHDMARPIASPQEKSQPEVAIPTPPGLPAVQGSAFAEEKDQTAQGVPLPVQDAVKLPPAVASAAWSVSASPATEKAAVASPAGKQAARSWKETRHAPMKSRRSLAQPVKAGVRMMAAGMGAFWRALSGSLRYVLRGLLIFFRRLLPDESVFNISTPNISPATMLFLAVAVSVSFAVIGGTTYLDRGQSTQHQLYYQQALSSSESARQVDASANPQQARQAWEQTLGLLDAAESYKVTSQSQELRAEAVRGLDLLDGVERLEFQPAIFGGLDEEVQVTRMVATAGEIYLLNGTEGNVIRAILTGNGYQVDAEFVCGPISAQVYVGPLIDIALAPRGSEEGATILGMDAAGNLEFCIPGGQPLIASLMPPRTGFSALLAFTVEAGDLYVLDTDPETKAIWIYPRMDFTRAPHFFFGDKVPYLLDVIDMAVNNNDLYLLHADGRQTMCTYSVYADAPTRCQDPIPYTDPRPGRQNGPIISDSLFGQIYFSPPPDPSLYLLDPNHQAVFHFSLRMTFQRQYRSTQPLGSSSATAFVISPTRLIFIAMGNAVYYAALP